MSKYSGRTVLAAALAEGIFIPGFGDIKKELTSSANAMSNEIKMTVEDDYVVLHLKNKVKGGKSDVLVPIASFKYIILDKEEVKPLAKPYLK